MGEVLVISSTVVSVTWKALSNTIVRYLVSDPKYCSGVLCMYMFKKC